MSRPRSYCHVRTLCSLLPAALLACGDDGRATAGESATGTASAAPTSTSTGELPTTGGQSASATDGDAGTASDSAASDSTSTTGVTAGGSTTATTTSDTTTGDTPFCGDAPPKGYMGMVNAACKTEPNIGTFNPVVEWSKQVFAVAPESNQVMMTPVVAPLTDDDGDGVYGSDGDMPAVLYVTYTHPAYLELGVLRAVSGDGQKELLSIAGQGIAASSGIAVGNVDDDPAPEIAAVGLGGTLKVFEHDGTPKWTSAAYPGDITYHQFAAPAIADLDADTLPEFIIGRVILNNDGSTRGVGMYGTGALIYGSTSFAADMDDDGKQEVIVGNAIYKDDGSHVWSTAEPDGYPAVADFDGDGGPEIVVVSPGEVRLQTAGGGMVWKVPNPAQVGGPPTIADFDGDGQPEIGVAGKTGYVVFDTDGTILWQKATQDASSAITGSSVYDFEGDGIADVVYADEVNLYVYSGIDGATKLTYDGHNSGTLIEYPIVVDVDNDKQVEIVVIHNNLIESNYGITVVGDADKSWRPGRKVWNQHAYNITNVDDDAGIPAVPAANWKTYNNFRSGDLSANDGLAAPDLVSLTPESCLNECTGPDEVTIWVQLGNTGAAPLTAGADIEVYGTSMGVESLIKTVPFDMVLQPGQFADGVGIPVISTGLDQIRVVAKPKEAECVVDPANEIVLMAPFCSIPG